MLGPYWIFTSEVGENTFMHNNKNPRKQQHLPLWLYLENLRVH